MKNLSMIFKEMNKNYIFILISVLSASLVQAQLFTHKDTAGVEISGDTVVSTAPTSWDNSGGNSVQTLGENGYVSGIPSFGKYLKLGLSEVTGGHNYNEYNYCFYVQPNGVLDIYNGPSRIVRSTYNAGDVLKIEKLGNSIIFYKNGTSMETIANISETNLHVDYTFYDQNAQITFVDFASDTSVNTVNSWTSEGNNIFITNQNNNVGIGTKNPISKLEVNGDISLFRANKIKFLGAVGGEERAYIRSTNGENGNYNSLVFAVGAGNESMIIKANEGNVGIGTLNPKSKLHIQKGLAGGVPHSFSDITVEQNDHGMISILTPNNKNGYFGFSDQDDDYVAGMQYEHATNIMKFRVNNHNGDMVINAKGDIGIGTETPDSKLSVNGKIHAKEVKIDLIGWPDYVFEEDYHLPSLKEVEKHIQEKGHLQNIPSAAQVQKNGILVGEMNKKLLEKIEELTLYTIAQEKQLKQQQKINKALEDRLAKLEAIVSEK